MPNPQPTSEPSEPTHRAVRSEYAYTTRVLLAPRDERTTPEEALLHHKSLPAVLAYLTFNNLLPGTPSVISPYAEVLHIDGQPLTDEESKFLSDNDRDLDGYISRGTIEVKNRSGGVDVVVPGMPVTRADIDAIVSLGAPDPNKL